MKLTRQQKKIVEASVLISRDQPTSQDKAFLARHLVQTTLPHRNPGDVPFWMRKNGNLTLIMQQGIDGKGQPRGYPYGTIPRLLLYWMTTEAIRTKKPRLYLGGSLTDFMIEIGLNPNNGNGKRSDMARLKEQISRLFSCLIRFNTTGELNGIGFESEENMFIALKRVLWWDTQNQHQQSLWESYIDLDLRFYETITRSIIPVDMRALRAIKNSPLALDLYSLLTYQAYRASEVIHNPVFMSWQQLQSALGTDYADTADLKKSVRPALEKINSVYPKLKLGKREGGIEIMPESATAIINR